MTSKAVFPLIQIYSMYLHLSSCLPEMPFLQLTMQHLA